MHSFAVDAIHAIDACNVEQCSAVRISLDVQLLVGFSAGIIFSGRRFEFHGPIGTDYNKYLAVMPRHAFVQQ